MSTEYLQTIKEHLKSIDLNSIKEFLIEFGDKLSSSNNLACLIALLFIDILMVSFLIKANKERKYLSIHGSDTAPLLGLSIGEKYFPFNANEVLIGRHTSCDIRSVNMTVSRYHAIVSCINGQWYVQDMHSTHGTYINGTMIEDITPIHNGDDLQFGEQHFTIEDSISRQQRLSDT